MKYFIATIIAFKMPLMQITECIKTSGAEPQTPLLLCQNFNCFDFVILCSARDLNITFVATASIESVASDLQEHRGSYMVLRVEERN